MKPGSLLIAALLVATAAVAQQMPRKPSLIKGHTIGETAEDFLRREETVQAEFNQCRAFTSPHLWNYCKELEAAFEKKTRGEVSVTYVRANPDAEQLFHDQTVFTFAAGKLVGLAMWVDDDLPYEAVKADLVAKFGPLTAEKRNPRQNGFGARWTQRIAVWDTPGLHAQISDRDNPWGGDPRVLVIVSTRHEYLENIRNPSNRQKPLE